MSPGNLSRETRTEVSVPPTDVHHRRSSIIGIGVPPPSTLVGRIRGGSRVTPHVSSGLVVSPPSTSTTFGTHDGRLSCRGFVGCPTPIYSSVTSLSGVGTDSPTTSQVFGVTGTTVMSCRSIIEPRLSSSHTVIHKPSSCW